MFFRALEIEFHWSKTAIVIALIALPITAVFLPITGRLVDRFGVRAVAGISAALMAATFVALSIIGGSLVAFYAGFIAFNVLGGATGPISYTRPVAQSFVASRGTAVAIALSGIAISGVVLPLLQRAPFNMYREVCTANVSVADTCVTVMTRCIGHCGS